MKGSYTKNQNFKTSEVLIVFFNKMTRFNFMFLNVHINF